MPALRKIFVCMSVQLIQNDDLKVRLIITNGTDPFVINSLNDYQVYLYFHTGAQVKRLLTVYKNDGTGEHAITVEDSAAGKVTIVVPRSLTKTLPAGLLYAEVKLQLNSTSDYINGKANVGGNGYLIAEILTSSSPNSLT